MELTFLGTSSGVKNCPNVYATDRGTLVVQGTKVTDPDALATMHARGVADHETAVEIPLGLMKYFPLSVASAASALVRRAIHVVRPARFPTEDSA